MARFVASVSLIYTTGCGLVEPSCDLPDTRSASNFARFVAPDSTVADAYVGVGETRGGDQHIWVRVQGYPVSSTVLPLPPLAGHVLAARLSTVNGGDLLRLPLHVETMSVSEIGTSIPTVVSENLYNATRDALLGGTLIITLETDSTVTLTPGTVSNVRSQDWTRACAN